MGTNSRRRKERMKARDEHAKKYPLFGKYKFVPYKQVTHDLQSVHEWFADVLLSRFDSMADDRAVAVIGTVLRWYQEYDTMAAQEPSHIDFRRAGKTVHLPLACAPGCNHCCVTPVSVIGPEAVLISEYIKARFTDDEITALVARIYAREAAVDGRQDTTYMCPLNVGGKCTVYDVRPFNCRKFHSFDEAVCRQAFLEGKIVMLPRSPVRDDDRGIFWGTVSGVLRALDFDTGDVDFIPALMIALKTSQPAKRLAAGEALFTAVRWQQ